ncbi:MAG: hemolysin family protein [Candidatus Marinimicrobia bacterium]|nr:hemolysin family protein [Candidatus Neomarinimicrobiota bacterium]
MQIELFFILLGIIFSAYFSSAEIAFMAANPIKIRIWADSGKTAAKRTLEMLEKREDILTMILVGNNLANIFTTSFATLYFLTSGLFTEFQIILIVSFIILIFGELIPKSIVQEIPNQTILFFVVTIRWIRIILLPITWPVQKIIQGILKIAHSKPEEIRAIVTRDEFGKTISLSHKSGVIDEQEKEYIHNVIDFSRRTAGEIQTPRPDIVGLPVTADIEEARKLFVESGFSKLLIWSDSIDEIIGFIVIHDLLHNPKTIKEIVRPIKVYPESKFVYEMLREFQENNMSIAVVVNEYGSTSGIVTMEDLVEEIFGEFEDEYDEDHYTIKVLSNGDLVMGGRTDIEELNKTYYLGIPDGDYETIAGYILENIDHFPVKNEKIILNNLEFTILKASPKSIEYLKIHPLR